MAELKTGNLVSSHDLPALVKSGLIHRGLYVKALSLFRNAQAWHAWALRALLALGAGHVLAGLIFFFAYNWLDLSETVKFSLVLGGMVISALAWIGLKLDKPIAQMFGISLTVLIGVFLAVFGQVFQTPAALYTPFTMWAIMALPFAAISRSLAHWAVWLVLAGFAANGYIVLGLEHIYGERVLPMALTAVAAAFFALLIAYDRVQNSWPEWARAGWFRVLLVVTIFIFTNIALANAVLDRRVDWFWPLIFVLAAGGFFYLYILRDSKFTIPPPARIASLVLAASGIGVMAAQIGLRAIAEVLDGSNSFVFGLLLAFLWMAFLTFLLAKAFKHFVVKFKAGDVSVDEIATSEEIPNKHAQGGDFNPSKRLDVGEFSSALQIDAETTSQTVSDAEDNVPWYMEMFLGFAGFFTAILAMSFFGTFLAMTLNIERPESFLMTGLVVYGLALFARLRFQGLFSRHFFNTLLMGGGALAVVGAALFFEGELGFILLSMAMSALTLWLVRDRILEFLMAAGFAGLILYGVLHYQVLYPFIWLYLVCVVLGVLCITLPVKTGVGKLRYPRVLSAAGAAFLLTPCYFIVTGGMKTLQAIMIYGRDSAGNVPVSADWVERIVSVVIAGLVVWYLNRHREEGVPFGPPLFILLLLLAAIAFMPLGSAAALLMIVTGYILGLRSLTIVGTLAQIAFMVWYYYDLHISLLHKSLLLTGFGVTLLVVYFIASKRGGRHV